MKIPSLIGTRSLALSLGLAVAGCAGSTETADGADRSASGGKADLLAETSCAAEGGTCVGLTPSSCADGRWAWGETEEHSCGDAIGVACCLPAEDDGDDPEDADPVVRDLGHLDPPGDTLGDSTFALRPGDSLRFQVDGNQIFGIIGFEVSPEDLTVAHEEVGESDDCFGCAGTSEFTLTVPSSAALGTEYVLVSQTPFQVRNDPAWAFSFIIAVE